jgi:hypothetical protein
VEGSADSADADLDALLASFGDDFGSSVSAETPAPAADEEEMDADLAALLASL